MAGAIEGNLAEPDRGRDGGRAELTLPVLERGGFPRGRAKAPPGSDPAGRSRDDYLALLPQVVTSWEANEARQAELRECRARGRHFVFSYLTSREWCACAPSTPRTIWRSCATCGKRARALAGPPRAYR